LEFLELQGRLQKFTKDRNWEQFHSIRNLLLALVGEVGELSESVQWLGEIDQKFFKENPDKLKAFEEELADVLIYLIRLADVSGINLLEAAEAKIQKNENRYTVEKSKGNAEKR
jgi:NTP pyrophosphatase (non-canonical NTP hydrolase)